MRKAFASIILWNVKFDLNFKRRFIISASQLKKCDVLVPSANFDVWVYLSNFFRQSCLNSPPATHRWRSPVDAVVADDADDTIAVGALTWRCSGRCCRWYCRRWCCLLTLLAADVANDTVADGSVSSLCCYRCCQWYCHIFCSHLPLLLTML